MKKAILFGATGLVGSHLLQELLDNPLYEQVTVVVRNGLQPVHPKLKVLTGDYKSLTDLKDQIFADEVFITLGTTQKKTPDRDEYYQVDHDYPVMAAKIAKEKGAQAVFIVTAIGSDPHSKIFYLRTKGEAERDITAIGFNQVHIFRPSMITGNRKEIRPFEKILNSIWPAVSVLFIGKLSRYKGISAERIAKAMSKAASNRAEKLRIYYWQDMNDLS